MSEDARKPEHLVSIQATPSVDVLDDAVSKKKTHAPSADIYMKSWKIVSICLLLSTLFQSIKPSDPYLPKFFIDGKGISKEDVNNQIFEWRTYAYLASILPVSFLSETVLGYVPVIIIGLFCRLATQFIFYYGDSLLAQQLAQVIFGLSQSSKIIYSAHVYRMVPLHVFHRITGLLRAANLCAHVLGGFVGGQNVKESGDTNWLLIFSISQSTVSFGVLLFFIACFISWRTRKASQTADPVCESPSILYTEIGAGESILQSLSRKFSSFIKMIRGIYSSPTVVIWSCWWWTGFSLLALVLDFTPVLLNEINGKDVKTGYIFSFAYFSAASSAMLAGWSRRILDSHGLLLLSAGSLIIAFVLFVMSFIRNIYIAYACFIAYMGLNDFCYCSANAQVAIRIPEARRGVALLSNTLVAMIIETSIQIFCRTLGLDIRQKFVVYASIMATMSVVTLVLFWFLPKEQPLHLPDESSSVSKSCSEQVSPRIVSSIELQDSQPMPAS